jgi:DNA polymerase-3 subunit delta
MGLSSPQKLHSEVTSGDFKPIYYLFGSEDYRIGEAVKYIARQFVPDRQLTTNFQRLDGRKVKATDLIAEISVFPMLGERQAFMISDIQTYKPTELERILKLLQPADPNRVVIFTTPSPRTPKRSSAFFKKISAVAEVVEFGPLTVDQSRSVISSRLTEQGVTIEPEALGLLAGLVAGNRGALEAELGKLISYKADGTPVTRRDIEQIAAGYEVYNVFELADHVIAGNHGHVLKMVERLLAGGDSATGLLYFLSQHFISLYLVKAGKNLEPYRRWLESRFREQARKFELTQIESIIVSIARVDADLRRRRTRPELELDRLVLEIMAL